ncbi:hypothetical protein D7Z94_25185 [Ulvibacterium marinum]|uniref:Uncharacterized protein n=1 Tax=Ulvibacterium marinum TaxID=2419782 RepID=A0A3B0BS94_9FLAO|nr:hypothetical protein D7Z94_25185 [Ulvibacterium marinum]
MDRTEINYAYEFNFYESFELIKLLEDSIKSIWSQIPLKEREVREYEIEMNSLRDYLFFRLYFSQYCIVRG